MGSPEDLRLSEGLFPPEVTSDPFVLFHGTSVEAAGRIAAEGLTWRGDVVSYVDVERVLSIFEKLDWGGDDNGGWFVLKAFTKGCDFANSTEKPVFLAEGVHRALMYAQHDFAGGESARGVRKALADLSRLSTDADVFDRYSRRFQRRNEERRMEGRPLLQLTDQTFVKRELESVGEIHARTQAAWRTFTQGAVIAFRLCESDAAHMTYNVRNGVISTVAIAPTRVVGVAPVPRNYRYDVLADVRSSPDSLPSWDGIVASIRARQGSS